MIELLMQYATPENILFLMKWILPATIGLWLFWIVVASVAEKYGSKSQNPFVMMLYTAFVIVDVGYNFTFASVLFLELASLKRKTLTARLKFILLSGDYSEDEWRFKVALFMCKKMISPWQWNHCGMGFGKRK